MAAVDLTDAGDCGGSVLLQCLQETAVFGNGVKQMNKLFHKVPQARKRFLLPGARSKRHFFPRHKAERGQNPFPFYV